MTLLEKIELILITDLDDIREWYPFFASDWLTSLRLRVVKPGARGLLVDLMAYTWDTGNPGVITLDDFFLFAQTYSYEKDDVHLWLKQLSISVQSPVQVMDMAELTLVIIPRLVDIGVKQIQKRQSCKTRGRKGGLASGSNHVGKEHLNQVQNDLIPIENDSELDFNKETNINTNSKDNKEKCLVGLIKENSEKGSNSTKVLPLPGSKVITLPGSNQSVGVYIGSGLNKVEFNELDPQLDLEGSEDSSRDKKRREENREKRELYKSGLNRPVKKKFAEYSEPFLRWYLGTGIDNYIGYPNKSGKRKAFGYWIDYGLDPRADEIIKETMRQIQERKQVMRSNPGEFLPSWPAAKTYINNERWEDSYLTESLVEKKAKAAQKKQDRSVLVFFPETGAQKVFPSLTNLQEYADEKGFKISLLDGEYRLIKRGEKDDD